MAAPAHAATGDIIVRRVSGLDRAERLAVRRDAGVTLTDTLRLPDTEVVHARPGELADALQALNDNPDVLFAEVDRPVRAATDDPDFHLEWGLENTGQTIGGPGVPDADIDAPEAWTRTKGAGVTVAVADTGVMTLHPDLAGQLTGNPAESGANASNGVDDDGNGLVDDWQGWDFIAGDNDADDEYGHGTHVAGTIGAAADNGIGIAGVAPDAKLLPVRVLDADGSGSDDSLAEGFDYAGDLGVRIVNASLGGIGTSQTVTNAMTAHPNTLYVVAAGNDGADVDATPYFPCTSPATNVVCVGATDNLDRPAGFSNFGATTVDLFAPGRLVFSSTMDGLYDWKSGTSMATPHVAGVAALTLAADASLTTAELKARLLASADRVPALTGKAVTGGRLNAATAVFGPTPTPTPTPTPAPPVVTPPPAPTPVATPTAPPAVTLGALTLSGRLTGRSGRLKATFTATRPTPVTLTIAQRRCTLRIAGCTIARLASWRASARAGANTVRLSRNVRGHTLKRGRYTLTVAAGASRREAAFRVR